MRISAPPVGVLAFARIEVAEVERDRPGELADAHIPIGRENDVKPADIGNRALAGIEHHDAVAAVSNGAAQKYLKR